MLTSGVIITLIICGTLIIMSIVSAVGKAHERKMVNKQLNNFSKSFPNFDKKLETPEKKDKDDFFKPF